jgi:hypothetical protein
MVAIPLLEWHLQLVSVTRFEIVLIIFLRNLYNAKVGNICQIENWFPIDVEFPIFTKLEEAKLALLYKKSSRHMIINCRLAKPLILIKTN